MKVLLPGTKATVEISGPMKVSAMLRALDLNREAHLVIEGRTLVPTDALLARDAEVEIRSVISGG